MSLQFKFPPHEPLGNSIGNPSLTIAHQQPASTPRAVPIRMHNVPLFQLTLCQLSHSEANSIYSHGIL